MGNSVSGLRAAGQQARRKLPPAPNEEQTNVINRIAAQEQARLRDLPSPEELQAKDAPLDDMLSKISAAIQPRSLDITQGQIDGKLPEAHLQQQSTTPGFRTGPVDNSLTGTAVQFSLKDRRQPIPEYRPSGLSREQLEKFQGRQKGTEQVLLASDDEPGRIQAYVIREIMEAKNESEAARKHLDLQSYAESYGATPEQIEKLFSHCAIPLTGRVKTFGHEYAFARPPAWWLPKRDGAMFVSEAAVLQSSTVPGASNQQQHFTETSQRRTFRPTDTPANKA